MADNCHTQQGDYYISSIDAFESLDKWNPSPALVSNIDLITKKVSQVINKSTSRRDWDSLCKDFLVNDKIECSSQTRFESGALRDTMPITNFEVKVQAFKDLRARYFAEWENDIMVDCKSVFIYGSGSKKCLLDTFLHERIIGRRETVVLRPYDNAFNAREAMCAVLRNADPSLESLTPKSMARKFYEALEGLLVAKRKFVFAIHTVEAVSVESLVRDILLPLVRRHGKCLQIIVTFDDCRWMSQCDLWRVEENEQIKLYRDVDTFWDFREEIASTYLVRRGETKVCSRSGEINHVIFEGLRISHGGETPSPQSLTDESADESESITNASTVNISDSDETETRTADLSFEESNFLRGFRDAMRPHFESMSPEQATRVLSGDRPELFLKFLNTELRNCDFSEKGSLTRRQVDQLLRNTDVCDILANELTHLLVEMRLKNEEWVLEPFVKWSKTFEAGKIMRWKEVLNRAVERVRRLPPSDKAAMIDLMTKLKEHCPNLNLQQADIKVGYIHAIDKEDLIRLSREL